MKRAQTLTMVIRCDSLNCDSHCQCDSHALNYIPVSMLFDSNSYMFFSSYLVFIFSCSFKYIYTKYITGHQLLFISTKESLLCESDHTSYAVWYCVPPAKTINRKTHFLAIVLRYKPLYLINSNTSPFIWINSISSANACQTGWQESLGKGYRSVLGF